MPIRHCLLSVFLVFLTFIPFIFVSGCGLFNRVSSSLEQVQSSRSAVEKKPVAVYHDFEDVLVPEELTILKDRTVIVSTPGFRSGILALRGRVESNSLYNFFSTNMEKDNWEILSRIKAPETIIMVFQKATRCAVITIREEAIYTYVEIGIAPTLGGVSKISQAIRLTDDDLE
ncbi:MAG: hypothetical protein CSA25_03310 [Desulfobacter postgatei]|uniref:Lipoprotein n=1 Tax=Desulfobacter postgatei TaxID=2293 RepID=A0A2G6MS51_9BACT|nr:MAG: hypothetical protein CSA25_03310 [Desulfobacter postgatei]